jgi:hypothetical protein
MVLDIHQTWAENGIYLERLLNFRIENDSEELSREYANYLSECFTQDVPIQNEVLQTVSANMSHLRRQRNYLSLKLKVLANEFFTTQKDRTEGYAIFSTLVNTN